MVARPGVVVGEIGLGLVPVVGLRPVVPPPVVGSLLATPPLDASATVRPAAATPPCPAPLPLEAVGVLAAPFRRPPRVAAVASGAGQVETRPASTPRTLEVAKKAAFWRPPFGTAAFPVRPQPRVAAMGAGLAGHDAEVRRVRRATGPASFCPTTDVRPCRAVMPPPPLTSYW